MQRRREELFDPPGGATGARRTRRSRTKQAMPAMDEHPPVPPEIAERPPRVLPRPFTFHWGGGQIVEEATMVEQYHEPTIQLLEYESGAVTLRFCSYNHNGMFQRSPLMVDEKDIEGLREALKQTPRIRALLRKMLE